jgi:hypothetical protein
MLFKLTDEQLMIQSMVQGVFPQRWSLTTAAERDKNKRVSR